MKALTLIQMMTACSGADTRTVLQQSTSFSKLSEAAQEVIVNTVMGEYTNGPPVLPESVATEIREWANTNE